MLRIMNLHIMLIVLSLLSNMAKCFIGLHKYEVIKEVEVKDVDTDTVVGINIVSRCTECGKINSTFISSDSRFLERDYVYINNKK